MEKPIIDLGEFDLHFLTESDEGEENDEMSNQEFKEDIESRIPEQTILEKYYKFFKLILMKF